LLSYGVLELTRLCDSEVKGRPKDETIHVNLAGEIVKALFRKDLDSKF
jgi:hypothetical protein